MHGQFSEDGQNARFGLAACSGSVSFSTEAVRLSPLLKTAQQTHIWMFMHTGSLDREYCRWHGTLAAVLECHQVGSTRFVALDILGV